MRVSQVSITNFRSLKSLIDVPLEEDITLLLGRNEGGKSNFLRSLEWFSTSDPIDDDDICSYSESSIETQVTVTFRFESDNEDKTFDFISVQPRNQKEFKVTKYADGKKIISINNEIIDLKPTINALFSRFTSFMKVIDSQTALSQQDTVLHNNLKKFRNKQFRGIVNRNTVMETEPDSEEQLKIKEGEDWRGIVNRIIAKLSAILFQNNTVEQERKILIEDLNSILGLKKGTADHTIILENLLPKVVYFSEVQKIAFEYFVSLVFFKDLRIN